MNKVIVTAKFRVTKNKGKSPAKEVYEVEAKISQDDQQAFAGNSCHCTHSANQDDNEPKKVTISLEC